MINIRKNKTNKPIFFIHIPKTAGTSFRLSAQKEFGTKRISYDYGIKSDTTTNDVREYIYNKNDYLDLKNKSLISKKMIAGHVNIMKYSPLVGASNTAIFIREPFQRLLSEYKHFKRHNNYKDNFESFYNQKSFQNRQSKFLNNFPIEAIGFLGITEKFDESIKLFNATFNTKLESIESNVAPTDIEPKQIYSMEEIKEINKLDYKLYESANILFENRLLALKNNVPPTFYKIEKLNKKQISGWAIQRKTSALTLHIYINGKKNKVVTANRFRPDLFWLYPDSKGYLGFDLQINGNAGDTIEINIGGTSSNTQKYVIGEED